MAKESDGMKRQVLTQQQYQRANKVMLFILAICYYVILYAVLVFGNGAGTQVSKETIDSTFDSMKIFSETVDGTFEQLQILKETAEK